MKQRLFPPPSSVHRGRGFTLIEILAALVVVAVALTAAVKLTGQSALNVAYLRDKTYAHWVAKYVVAEYRLMDQAPSSGQLRGSLAMGNQNWDWRADLEDTDDEAVRRLRVNVEKAGMHLSLEAFVANTAAVGQTP